MNNGMLGHRLLGELTVRIVLAATWALQGILIVARPPIEISLLVQYLGQGIATAMISISVATSLLMALLLVLAPSTKHLATIQVVAVLVSTAVVTAISPDLWFDAYGSLAKNGAFTIAVLAWEKMRNMSDT